MNPTLLRVYLRRIHSMFFAVLQSANCPDKAWGGYIFVINMSRPWQLMKIAAQMS
jgi:hypothetical protein